MEKTQGACIWVLHSIKLIEVEGLLMSKSKRKNKQKNKNGNFSAGYLELLRSKWFYIKASFNEK